MRRIGVLATVVLIACLSVGCSSKVSVEQGKERLDELAARGVPERHMSALRMYVFHMEAARRVGNGSQFRIYQDSLTRGLAEFEAQMNVQLQQAVPYMDSVMRSVDERIALLSRMHLDAAQRGRTTADSLMKIESRRLEARNRVEQLSLDIDTLVMRQQLADSLRPRAIGLWVTEKESADPRFRLVERTEIVMRPNNELEIMEGAKGQRNENSREDWVFRSFGTWDLMGNVVHKSVNREKRERQMFEGINPATGRRERQVLPPYDSTVAPRTKDRFITWDALNEDYKRFNIPRGR
jgi:hypothetical protein